MTRVVSSSQSIHRLLKGMLFRNYWKLKNKYFTFESNGISLKEKVENNNDNNNNHNNNRYHRSWVFRNQCGWEIAVKNIKESRLVEKEYFLSAILVRINEKKNLVNKVWIKRIKEKRDDDTLGNQTRWFFSTLKMLWFQALDYLEWKIKRTWKV